jgi:hypothetical protein
LADSARYRLSRWTGRFRDFPDPVRLRHVAQCEKKNARFVGVFEGRSKTFRCKLRVLADPANHRLVV